jgi:glycosyltransferase involved in cell wall biosynthesis
VRVAAAVLTYNPVLHARVDLLDATVRSLAEADELILCDNGSDDEASLDLLTRYRHVTHRFPCHTSGFGTNFAARQARATGADICIVSDDDIFWRAGWRNRLEAWWTAAPTNLILTGCHLEPLFPWNRPYGTVAYGDVPGVLRESTGAATWSFRPDDWHTIGPIPSRIQGWGDVPACNAVRAHGYDIAQLDLADHHGHGRSTWGNTTLDGYGWELGPVRALLEGVSCVSA